MKYYTFHILDSGSVEERKTLLIEGKTMEVCKMYDDPEFNSLNDFLHSTSDLIMNSKALDIIKSSQIIDYQLNETIVTRREKLFLSIRRKKEYLYYLLQLNDGQNLESYDWIDFNKSHVFAINKHRELKVTSHQQTLDLIDQNVISSEKNNYDEIFSFKTKKINFNHNFNSEVDLFHIPLYSFGIYVSDRFRNKLLEANISDIGFAESKSEIGKVWESHFPIIEFS